MYKRVLLFTAIILFFASFSVLTSTEKDLVILKPTIYGDQEGVECLYNLIKLESQYSNTSFGLNAFSHLYDRRDKAILVHLIGDRLNNRMAKEFYDLSLEELDLKTRSEQAFYRKTTIFDQPALLISTLDTDTLKNLYKNNNKFKNSLEEVINAQSSRPIQTRNLTWRSTVHKPKVFRGLFKNPDYSNLDLFLQEDALTERTEQVMKVADIINNKKDISTLKEIFNLLKGIRSNRRPDVTFEVTATEILSTPVLSGCTTYATAFATLCRAKGIPAVVVDSAYIDWINNGCQLNHVRGHFFVEVYIDNTWYLVDSTAGELYHNYDRNNWFLPSGYIAFTKSLSFIDPGTTEKNHNLLQRVAFVNKEVSYEDPGYRVTDLNSYNVENSITDLYEQLNLTVDTGNVITIEAGQEEIDYTNIK
ncbi:MAG: transglutaminase domain-containing protein [Halanaerobiales bacterium]